MVNYNILMDKIYSINDFGGWNNCIHLCGNSGIGDLSWLYSALSHLPRLTNKKIILSVAAQNELKRSGEFVQMLPNFYWGGYDETRNSFFVMSQTWPCHPMNNGCFDFFVKPWIQNASLNLHLECGRKIADWMPHIPVEYHYELNIPQSCSNESNQIMDNLPRPIIGVYVSNRRKDMEHRPGWSIFKEAEWIWLLKNIYETPQCKQGSFILLGADYDADRTNAVADALTSYGCRVARIVGRHLGTAISCIKKCHYFISFPGGLGIISNVVRTPCIMMLPHILTPMENTYADPMDIAYSRYKNFVSPKVEDVLDWFKRIGMPANFHWIESFNP